MTESLFSGMKVIDCGSYIAAPASTTVLAEYGADVIKIEPLGIGDAYRQVSGLPGMPESELEYGALMTNRSKRGLAIDLDTDDGRRVAHRLVADADVFVTNLPLRSRGKLGLDYETLSALNDRLVYGSFTAFGEVGDEAGKPGFDTTAYWARSGLMDQVRVSASDEPAKSVPGLGDHPSAMALYAGIITALFQRERTGKGSLVRSSLLANGMWANGYLGTAALNSAQWAPRPPRRESLNALSTPYECRDGRFLLLGILNEERHWPVLCECLGLPDLPNDPRYATKPDRLVNSTALFEQLQGTFATNDRDHWQAALQAGGIVFEVVATAADVCTDEQAARNGVLVPFADAPTVRTIGTPFSVEGIERVPVTLPPAVGQHTDELLAEAGFTPDEIESMRACGTIA